MSVTEIVGLSLEFGAFGLSREEWHIQRLLSCFDDTTRERLNQVLDDLAGDRQRWEDRVFPRLAEKLEKPVEQLTYKEKREGLNDRGHNVHNRAEKTDVSHLEGKLQQLLEELLPS